MNKLHNKLKSLAGVFLILWLFFILWGTVFCRTPGSYTKYFEPQLFWSYKRIIETHSKTLIIQVLENIFLLFPLGFILPYLLEEKMPSVKKRGILTIFIGFCTTSVIEFLQYIFRMGLCEFDDIFHNTLGVTMGYLTYRVIYKWLRKENT